jgi:hypothetical protein
MFVDLDIGGAMMESIVRQLFGMRGFVLAAVMTLFRSSVSSVSASGALAVSGMIIS